jgi:hypothetical protein
MKKETNVPSVIEHKHVGCRVLFRLPNQVVISEGVIDGLSPEGEYVRIGKRWVENGSGAILSFLPNSHRRKDALA